jgi:hypothetical protein
MSAHRFGLDHPAWERPDCFLFDTAEDAQRAKERAYGPESEHVVIEGVTRGATR